MTTELQFDDQSYPKAYSVAEYNSFMGRKSIAGASHGASDIISLSKIKAIAEGVERYFSGSMKVDLTSKASNILTAWLDPSVYYPLHKSTYDHIGNIQPFDQNMEMQWVLAENVVTADSIFVPIDFVYYPIDRRRIKRRLTGFANSSGVAAHSSVEKASENGLLELIERDAAMVTWYAKRSVSAIPISFCSSYMSERIRMLQEHRYDVKILNITLDSIPVVQVFIYSKDQKPALASGAAAAFTFDEAIEKSFNEAETQLLTWRGSTGKKQSPKFIRKPEDHARLYFVPENLQQLSWLIESEEVIPKERDYSYSDLLEKFDPIRIILQDDTENGGLCVVRIISKNLLPINFGENTEYYGHGRMKMLDLSWKRSYPSFPHYFA